MARIRFKPRNCALHSVDDIGAVVRILGGRQLIFIGDSLTKQNAIEMLCALHGLALGNY